MSSKLKFAGNIRRLRLRPGDTIVVEATEKITANTAEAIRDQLKEKFPDNEVVVADRLHFAAVLRKDAA